MEYNKRVYCLYRVSTIGQVEKNDIPMQRECCREFAAGHKDWSITKELYEKGVSGFKTSAKDRDAIQEIQADAVEGKFDILLVFMFDRLGRRDDETPFVVEWFVKNGIEVWSAMEGQQRFDTHVDKLMNYIRYWQASGESIKTSIRVRTRMEQLTEAGLFTGGSVPYGYKLVKSGRVNKRNREVSDLVIDEDAAEIIRLIFYKYVYEGFGAQRLCKYLAEMNIYKEDGRNFPNTSINRIIKNELYTGVIHNGEAKSEVIPELRIIERETYERAQAIMQGRVTHHNEIPLNLKSGSLLVGNVFCGHCGNRLTLTTSGRTRKGRDGQIHFEARPRYGCHYKQRHPGECDGQSGYGVHTLDGIVDQIIRRQLERIKTSPNNDIISEQHQKAIDLAEAHLRIAKSQVAEKQREITDYQNEAIRVIRGESKFSDELLDSLVKRAKEELKVLTEAVSTAQEELDILQTGMEREIEEYDRLLSWAEIYDTCSFESKKMFVSQFVKSVRVYRDYNLEIEFNVSFDEFKEFRRTGQSGDRSA